jgi:hypothetical protein
MWTGMREPAATLPLAGHGVEVGAALEIAQWLGGPSPNPPTPPRAGDARIP